MAELAARDLSGDVYSLELTDPYGTLATKWNAYKRVAQSYDAVCAATVGTTYCAAAQFRKARLAEDFIGVLQTIEINHTLPKQEVERFRSHKTNAVYELTRTVRAADERAEALVEQGATNPDWTQTILWHNSADWSLTRVTGETGSGYIQWNYRPTSAE